MKKIKVDPDKVIKIEPRMIKENFANTKKAMKTIKLKTEKDVKKFLNSNELGFNKNNVIINGIKPILGFNVSNKHITYYSSEKQATQVLTSRNGYFILENYEI